MEAWKKVWRDGFVPGLSEAELVALRDALLMDDKRILQGATTAPPPLHCVREWPVEACCSVAFCGITRCGKGEETTVADVEAFFAEQCQDCDVRLGEPAAARWFLNAVDSWNRKEMIQNLLPEVEWAIAEKSKVPF